MEVAIAVVPVVVLAVLFGLCRWLLVCRIMMIVVVQNVLVMLLLLLLLLLNGGRR